MTIQELRNSLAYRKSVGIAVFNHQGRVWLGKRIATPESNMRHVWQMPQGGIDDGEKPKAAALRELYEETNICSVEILERTKGWLYYDLPDELLGHALRGKFRGQKQKWFAMRFIGNDDEIDIHQPASGQHKPEFSDWRWESLANTPKLMVHFKQDVYRQVVSQFAHLTK